MKNLEIVIGSPRKKGNTVILVNQLLDSIVNQNLNSEKSFLYDMEIEPCTDCRGCKKGDLDCVISDDATALYSKLENSDIILFGTPIYWFGPSGKMKLLIDRLRPYYLNRKLEGKKAALILPAAVGEKDCDLTIEMFKRIFNTLGIEYLGAVTAKGNDIGEVTEDLTAIENIKKLALTLT